MHKLLRKSFAKFFLCCLFLVSVFVFNCQNLSATTTQHKLESKIKPKFGIYVTELFNLDFSKGSYETVFWAWWIYSDPSYKPFDSVELVNSLKQEVKYPFTHIQNGKFHSEAKYIARISQDWNVVNFPFDKQTVIIHLEDAHLDITQLEFVPDIENSGTSVKNTEGWRVTDFKIEPKVTTVMTNFGNENQKKISQYSDITVTIKLERDSLALLMKYYIGFFVAIFLAISVYFFPIKNIETRMGTLVGSIFSAVGNKYILDTTIPSETEVTFTNKIEVLTFALVILATIASGISVHLKEEGHKVLAQRVNALFGVVVMVASIVIILLFIFDAMHSM